MRCNSWIITNKATGAAVLETWSAAVARSINLEKYRVQTAHEYLVDLNKRIATQPEKPVAILASLNP